MSFSDRANDRPVLLEGIAVPADLVARPEHFGGTKRGDLIFGDLLVGSGGGNRMVDDDAPDGTSRIPSTGAIAIPGMVEAHCHLDKCHTGHRIQGGGGDLLAAIQAQNADMELWTDDDLRRRMSKGLGELVRAGCRAARSHIDWSHDPADSRRAPRAWNVAAELARDWSGRITLQRAVLTSLDLFGDDAASHALARHVSSDGGVLGAFVLDHRERRKRIERAFDLAERFGLPLDFHVDEGLDPGLDGLATIAAVALERRHEGPVTCGHALSLTLADGEALARLIDGIVAAGIVIVSLPTTNLYLQDRGPGTPRLRGVTRLRELKAAGVPTAIGSDNVCDAFCPVGRHDPLHALSVAVIAGHLDPPLGPWLQSVTTDAARAIGLDPAMLDDAPATDIVIAQTSSIGEFVAGTNGPPVALATWVSAHAG